MMLYVLITYNLIKIGLNLYDIRFEDELYVNRIMSITVYDEDGNIDTFLQSQLDYRRYHCTEYDSFRYFIKTMYPDLVKNAHFTNYMIDNPRVILHENKPCNDSYELSLCTGLFMATSLMAYGYIKYFTLS